jgi:hypothetical protein
MKTFKDLREAKDSREYDFEGEMAKNDLYIISMHAQRVSAMLQDDTNLPEWVQSKITLAKSYMSSVDDYLSAEMREGVDEDTVDEDCWKGYKAIGLKKKNGKTVPNCVPVTESTKQKLKAFMLYKDKNDSDEVNFDKIKVHNKFVRNTLNKMRKLKNPNG